MNYCSKSVALTTIYINRYLFQVALAFLLFVPLTFLHAVELHVSPNGKDANPGSSGKPFQTIQAAINKMKPGDICVVHNGTYRERISIKQSGSIGAPIVIRAAAGETPIISGLDVLSLRWKKSDKKGVFVADYKNDDFEQLFYEGKPMLEARWPNTPRDQMGDWDFFSPNAWAAVDPKGNSYGTIKDADLAATGWDVTGATAVLNVVHQFYAWTRSVEGHSAGSDTFNYPKDLGSSVKGADETGTSLKCNDDRYYLIGKKEFLDVPGEWFYDSQKKQLFVITPDGKNPDEKLIEVKTRNFSLTADQNAKYITIDGITFFGTAFSFGRDYQKRSNNIVFQNNKVLYSSWTEYLSMPKGDSKESRSNNYPVIYADNSLVCNNVFEYGALSALFINGFSNQIENNLIHDFDTNSSLEFPPLLVNRNWKSYVGNGGKAIVRYNTIYNSGGILNLNGQNDNDVYMNHLYNAFRACWGGNKDVSSLYCSGEVVIGTRFHHNWVHDMYAGTPPIDWNGGMGIRGDDNTCGLTIDHNVVWNTGSTGIMVKNPPHPTPEQANKVFNNTIFQHSKYNSKKAAIIVPSIGKSKKQAAETESNSNTTANQFSLVNNNLADVINGGWFSAPLGNLGDYSGNCTGKVVESTLENPNGFDFRPKTTAADVVDKGKVLTTYTTTIIGSAPDIGAYERGDSIYWIPGRRETKASFPIVQDGATIDISRDVLMWRPAYKAVSHNFYFGTSKDKLDKKEEFSGERNVFFLSKLAVGMKYFWRVDAVMADGSVATGDVWSFTIMK
jgi:hypothetical protein